jgi:hypothetical protein
LVIAGAGQVADDADLFAGAGRPVTGDVVEDGPHDRVPVFQG